jgi:hypothetical protein
MANELLPEESLLPDQSLTSANGRYTLVYQGDGNLALCKDYPGLPSRWL